MNQRQYIILRPILTELRLKHEYPYPIPTVKPPEFPKIAIELYVIPNNGENTLQIITKL